MKTKIQNRQTLAGVHRFKTCTASQKAAQPSSTLRLIGWQLNRHFLVVKVEVRHAQ
jgi:hypothetical protein